MVNLEIGSAIQSNFKMITVLFFASLREELNTSRITVSHSNDINNLADVLNIILTNNPSWASALSDEKLICAVNHKVSAMTSPVTDGDEVAFYPPVTGG